MEIQLQDLIEQIKQEGVAAAEAQAAQILADAKTQAEQIVADARKEADRLTASAKAEQERMVRVSEDAIVQAGRNLLITLRDSVNREVTALVGEGVAAAYAPSEFAALLARVIEAWAAQPEAEDVTVLLNAADLEALEATVRAALKGKLGEGITLRPDDSFDGGFRMAMDGGRVYYDYSASAVVEMLSAYLSPKVTALMKEAQQA